MAADELTIDQLAQRIGMTVRNIRAHQSRGLLPPPEVRGRTGYYGADHIARLELIQELQADGFNLDLIRRLLDDTGPSSGEFLRFKHALAEPFGDEQPRMIELAELAREWNTNDLRLLERARALGVVRQLPDGTFELRSPRLARGAAQLAQLGIPLDQALAVAAQVRTLTDGIADSYVELFLERVWKPFEAAGSPPERWPEVRDALERMRPLATEGLVALFGLSMSDAVEHAFGRELERMTDTGEPDPA